MKKDYNTKKKATIIALSLTAVCFAGGLFYYVGTLNNSEPPTLPTQTPPSTESRLSYRKSSRMAHRAAPTTALLSAAHRP